MLTNIEAYDQWPSQPELKCLKAIVNPLTSPIVFTALKSDWVRHRIFRIAVHDERTLNRGILAEWVTPHTASGERRQRLRRFFRWQLDKEHNNITQAAVPSIRRFSKPTLLVWGEQDTNFGPALAKRLAADIPGVTGTVWMKDSAHMPMVEEPAACADAVLKFMRSESAAPAAPPRQVPVVPFPCAGNAATGSKPRRPRHHGTPDAGAQQTLYACSWPGNVRELNHALGRRPSVSSFLQRCRNSAVQSVRLRTDLVSAARRRGRR